jgi:Apea-like HEPN
MLSCPAQVFFYSAEYNEELVNESSLKANLQVLAEQAAHRVASDDRPLQYFGGAMALLDSRRDQTIIELPGFEAACTALGTLPIAQERYGAAPHREPVSERLTLQFVYGFLGNLSEPNFDPGVFETSWEAFWRELLEPEWTWLGLANLQNFRSETMLLNLGDGITIRGRSFEELIGMGWSEGHLERLEQEWLEGGGPSSHVILTEHKLPKSPDNFVLSGDTRWYQKVERAILALRLHKDGDIGIGRLWFLRPASFKLAPEGGVGTGFPPSIVPGSEYTFDEPDLSSVRDLYDMLLHYEKVQDRAPVNLNLALRSFSDSYERYSFRGDKRLVDAITAAEALLGTRAELSFRLPFRVAAILGSDHDDRLNTFKQMRDYYEVRSRVVHGDELGDRQRRKLRDQQVLRTFVRRLLSGFIHLTTTSGHSFDRQFFDKNLDISLLDDSRRSALRVAMGLEESD